MNEPALFVPQQRRSSPTSCTRAAASRASRQVHNLYGSQMAQAAREGLARLRPDRRPFVITRAGYAGLQRHALQWTGDNSSWWEHLWMSMPQLQNLGLSGVAHCGVDIGGFFNDATGELLARWAEMGTFQPFVRSTPRRRRTRRSRGRSASRGRRSAATCCACGCACCPTSTGSSTRRPHGAPILRPLLFEHPGDEATYAADDELLCGDALLVAPIARPASSTATSTCPRGPGAVVDRRAHRGTGARARARPARAPGAVRAPTRRSRCGPSESTSAGSPAR